MGNILNSRSTLSSHRETQLHVRRLVLENDNENRATELFNPRTQAHSNRIQLPKDSQLKQWMTTPKQFSPPAHTKCKYLSEIVKQGQNRY